MIYFIQDTGTLNIKLGWTVRDPLKRLQELQTGNSAKLELLAVIRGEAELEQRLLARFSAYRVSGEWLRPGPALLRYILFWADTLGFYRGTANDPDGWADPEIVSIKLNHLSVLRGQGIRALGCGEGVTMPDGP